MAFTQEHLVGKIDTPLGTDVLLLRGFTGREAISELFSYELDLASERADIDFTTIVGRPAVLTVHCEGETPRYINGIISGFVQAGADLRLVYYRARLVPWLWLLTQKQDCRIFQEKTVQEIIEQVFTVGGFEDFEFQLEDNHPGREYCVQYRETDFAFVSRLMEDEGISYHFRHDETHHQMVITDQNGGFSASPLRPEIRHDIGDTSTLDNLHAFELRQDLNPGKYAHTDFNFQDPTDDLFASSNSIVNQFNNETFVVYDYPGKYEDVDVGAGRAKLRMEAAEAEAVRVHGRSGFRELGSGETFQLVGHYRADFSQSYLVTSVNHELSQNLPTEGQVESAGVKYSNAFTCIPESVTLRPPLKTARPVIHGVQTALVVGPSGEELYTESFGRVKVQFHWDRDGSFNEESSCWIRVVQSLAGKRWGATFWPRMAQEVTVDFLEGDPDRPLVTGVVYNGQTMPPHTLPDDQTISGIKTNSSIGGEGFNEFRIEDKKGEEYIFLHAEKDHDVRVKNIQKEWIGATRHKYVEGDAYEKIGGEEHFTLVGDQFAKFEANQNVEVITDRRAKIGGSENVDVVGGRYDKVGEDLHIAVTGARKEKVDGTISREAGEDIQEKASNWGFEASSEIHLKGATVVLEGDSELTIKAGGSFVKLDSSGVAISGTMVKINSGGSAGSGSGSSPEAPEDPTAPDAPTEPELAMEAEAGEIAELPEWERVERDAYTPQALALEDAAESGAPFCEECAAAAAAAGGDGGSSGA